MAREALARMLAGGNDIACSAVAFEGSGFRAAFVRGVVTGLTILARHPFPNRIFAGVPEASSWLRSQMPRATSSFTTDFELIEGISNWRLDYARQLKVGSAA
jgi:hypothetical protein